MATTKRAQYRFVVKEGPELTHEPRDGVIELATVMFLSAEPCDRTPLSERPLEDPDFLSFDLAPGISIDEAQRIADFLNDHLLSVAITRFGDAKDAEMDVKHSDRVQRIELDRFSAVVSELREKLAVNDAPAAIEAMKAVESVAASLFRGWAKALATSQAILDAFGRDKDPYA